WWPPGHRQLITDSIEQVRQVRPGTPRQLRERALYVAEISETLDPSFDLDRLTVPCVAGCGTATFPYFQEGTKAFAATVRAELFELAGASHMVHREDVPGFAAFVRQVVAASASAQPPTPKR
nr:hypothetical protein [Micromonospora sp. DSM 115978]